LGRTILEGDAILFTTLTLSFNPLYFNRAYAEAHGHRDIVVNPQLVFNVVLGLSVEDLSEGGGPFLGVFDLTYDRPVYPGATITAASRTVEARYRQHPANGIVTWRARIQRGRRAGGRLPPDQPRAPARGPGGEGMTASFRS